MSTLLIEPMVLHNAIRACRTYILLKRNVDEGNCEANSTSNSLDRYLRQPYLGLSYDQWHEILTISDRCNECNFHHQLPFPHRKIGTKDTLRVMQLHCVLMELQRVNPSLLSRHHRHNIWIVKTAEGSKGVGIKICDSLTDILAMEKDFSARVVQKYIETPLLLSANNEDFKFDLRIWVLITSYAPLQVYVYNCIYGRRCSRPYSLDRTQFQNSLAHLTNYSLQKQPPVSSLSTSLKMKFNALMKSNKETASRSSDELLVNNEEISNLVNSNRSDAHDVTRTWETYTWPLIQSHIRNLITASLDSVVHRDRSFELLGVAYPSLTSL